MRLAVVGVGQAGGAIVDRLLAHDAERGGDTVAHAVAVNSAEPDLGGVERVPEADRLLVGSGIVGGKGAGADPETGARCVREDLDRVVDAVGRVEPSAVDAFLVVASLGGGTGSGGAPVIAERLGELYAEPVYGLGVLPAADEGGIYSRNAARALGRFVDATDNLSLFDNGSARRSGGTVSEGYAAINDEIATRFGALFSAGEFGSGADVAESVVDASEIVHTLGDRGITSLGYAAEPVETGSGSKGSGGGGLLDRIPGIGSGADDPAFLDDGTATNRIASLVRRATLGELTLPCEPKSADRALLVVSGPPSGLSRKGIESARGWLEEATGCRAVRAGDDPRPGADRVAALVALAGVTDVPRIEELQKRAMERGGGAETRVSTSEERTRNLIEYGDDS